MIVFPVLIPGPNFLFPGTGREIYNAMGREGKFEACIPGNNGKREFPLTPAVSSMINVLIHLSKVVVSILQQWPLDHSVENSLLAFLNEA